MIRRKNQLTLFVVFTAVVVFSGCVSQPVLQEAGDRGSAMVSPAMVSPAAVSPAAVSLAADAPPPPLMTWTPAGSFRRSDRSPHDVTAIVFHTTEGNYDAHLSFSANQAINYRQTIRYFQNNDRNVSAHFVVGPNGEICQMVAEHDVSFTQTYYNDRAIGIECAGWSHRPETWTPEMMEALVSLTAYLCVKWDIPAVHPQGTAWVGPNRIVLDEDNQRFTGQGLVGHFQIQPWNKTDPGAHFPWREFSERVRERIQEYSAPR